MQKHRNFIIYENWRAEQSGGTARRLLRGSNKARRIAAERSRTARQWSEAVCGSRLASMPPLQRGGVLCGSSTLRRSAAEQSRRARQ